MIIPNVNILVYAYDEYADRHKAMRAWWEQTLSGTEPVGLAWPVLLGFLRVSINRRVQRIPARIGDAISRVQSWMSVTIVELISPGENHVNILFKLLEETGAYGT